MVLGYFGFDRTVCGDSIRKKNRKWWYELRQERRGDIETERSVHDGRLKKIYLAPDWTNIFRRVLAHSFQSQIMDGWMAGSAAYKEGTQTGKWREGILLRGHQCHKRNVTTDFHLLPNS